MIKIVRLTVLMITAAISTFAWPIRSIARPQNGATSAPVIVPAAVINPARPNDPVLSDTSKTMPMPVIEIGSRAIRPARVKRRASGSANTCWYARSPAATSYSSFVRQGATPGTQHAGRVGWSRVQGSRV